jgi:hypothetical protein
MGTLFWHLTVELAYMAGKVDYYACDTSSLTGFPLTVTGGTPTRDNYTTGIDRLYGLIDLQFAPIVSGLTATSSPRGAILLQTGDMQSSVIYNTLKYSVVNVQLAVAQHSSWLISGKDKNSQDLIILLSATSPTSKELTYMIIVLPLIHGGAAASEPAYLTNIDNGTASGPGLQSCFPKKAAATDSEPLFAVYSTCCDGYTGHAHTQNVQVFVSTVGVPVSDATLERIMANRTIKMAELPSFIKPSSMGGKTEIPISLFAQYISVTSFSTDLTNVSDVATTRTDSTDAYKCVELDPDSLDANGNIQVDISTGTIASSTLNDILAERAVLKAAVTPAPTTKQGGDIAAFILVFIIIAGTVFGLYWSIFSNDKTNRGTYETVSTIVIGILLIAGAGTGLLSKDKNVQQQGGIVVGVGGLLGLLFYLFFFVVYPPPLTTECQKTAAALASGALAPGEILVKPDTPSIASTVAAATTIQWTTTKVAMLSTVLVVCSFLVGMIV